ncbi:hypothetical protein KI387_044687, partial [Taxus chinensis]
EIGVPDGPRENIWEFPLENKSPAKKYAKYTLRGTTSNTYKERLDKWFRRLCRAFEGEWCIPHEFPKVLEGEVEFKVYQHFSLGSFHMRSKEKYPWCKFPFAFTARYFKDSVNKFHDAHQLQFDIGKVD